MAKDREEYHLTISAKPDAGFRGLRVLTFEASRIRIRDTVLSVSGADDLLSQLETAQYDLHQHVFLVGMARKIIPNGTVSYSCVRKAWQLGQVLWILPRSSLRDVRDFWSKSSNCNAMDELKRHGFCISHIDGRLTYSAQESQGTSLASGAQQERSPSQRHDAGGRKRKAISPIPRTRARSRSRSPTKEGSRGERGRERSPTDRRRETDLRKDRFVSSRRFGLETPPASQRVLTSPEPSSHVARHGQDSMTTSGSAWEEHSMQTVPPIEEILEDDESL